jgi:WD40 repeat protein
VTSANFGGNQGGGLCDKAVKLDTEPPQVSCQPPDTTRWYREDVSVPCTASDSLSGLANSADASFTLIARGEGQAVSTGTHTVTDRAGNSTTAGPYTFQIDKTPPKITYTLSSQPNTWGWYNTDVTVSFQCEDALSGVASCSSPVTVSQEGKDLEVRGEAVDKAGNRAERTVTVNLDKTKPQLTLGEPQGTLGSEGWYRTDVVVPYTATDNLAGFSGGQRQLQGSARSSGEGSAVKVRVRVEDLAGNATEAEAGPFKVDQTPPTISASLNPQPNAQGWNNTDMTVRFSCQDALSGVASCSSPVTVSQEGKDLQVRGEAVDKAGNRSTTTVRVNIDKTPPTGSLTINDGAASTTSITVMLRITANDPLSGVAEMRFSNDGQTWSDWESFSSTKLWNVVPPTGSPLLIGSTVTVYAQLQDRAGNVSRAFSAAIQLKVTVLRNLSPLSLQFSDDRTLTLAVYRQSDRKLEISQWDASNGQSRILSVVSMPDEVVEVVGLSISPDWRLLAVHGWVEPTVYVVDVATGRVLRTLERDKPVIVVVFSPDSRTLAVGYQEATGFSGATSQVGIHLYDIRTWQLRLAIRGDHIRDDVAKAANFSESLTFSPDGSLIAAAATSCQGYVGLWDTVSGQLLRCFLPGSDDTSRIGDLAFTRDGRLLAGVNWRNIIWIWELATGRVLRKLDCNTGVSLGSGDAAFSPDGRVLAVSCNAWDWRREMKFQLWDLATGQSLISMPAPGAEKPTFSPSGQLLAIPMCLRIVSGCAEYGILLWNTNDLIRR